MGKDISILNDLFGPAFVINLKRSDDRRRYVNNLFKDSSFQYSFFEAIDAQHLDPNELARNGLFDVNKSRKYYRGWPHDELLIAPLACSLSHMKLWEYIIDHDLPAGIILEDDIEINDPVLNNLNSFLKDLPENWYFFTLDTWPITKNLPQHHNS